MKKTILIGALALALSACPEQVKEEGQVIKVDIANARPIAGNWDFALDFSRKCLFFGLDFSRNLLFFGLDFSKKVSFLFDFQHISLSLQNTKQ